MSRFSLISLVSVIVFSILALAACGGEPLLTQTSIPISKEPTETPIPSTATPEPTETPIPPTATPEPTETPIPSTATPEPTETPVPPTATPEPAETPIPSTATPEPVETPNPPTATPEPAETPITRPTTEITDESGVRRYPLLSRVDRFETPKIGQVELFTIDELSLQYTWRVSDRPEIGGDCLFSFGKPIVDSEFKWNYTYHDVADSLDIDLDADALLVFVRDCVVERVPGKTAVKQSERDTRHISGVEARPLRHRS